MSDSTFKVLELVLFFGAAFGFVIWQMIDVKRAASKRNENPDEAADLEERPSN